MACTSIFELFLKANSLVRTTTLILIIFSIVSWAVIVNKSLLLKTALHEIETFEDKFWSGIEFSLLYKEHHKQRENLVGSKRIFYNGFKEFMKLRRANNCTPEAIIAGTTRAMRISMSCELETIRAYIPLLDTISSVSPYIGLLGTVFGIMHAFISLGTVKLVTLQMIAPGVAEALISTAIALFTAIPAVVANNYLNQNMDKIELHYENFIEEFIAILYRQVLVGAEYKEIQYE